MNQYNNDTTKKNLNYFNDKKNMNIDDINNLNTKFNKEIKEIDDKINEIDKELYNLSNEREFNKKFSDSVDINNVNNIMIDLIENSKPFYCHRSRSEDLICYKLLGNETLTEFDYVRMNINCGVYPKYDKKVLNDYLNEYLEVYEKSDILCYHYINNLDIFNFLVEDKLIGNFINSSYPNILKKKSWLNKLNNKVVLIISPITDTIKLAYDTIDLDFEKFKEIKFYKSVQSICNNQVHTNWTESLNIMKNEIKNLEFDIALIGCGGYSAPLGLFIKEYMNKQAINMGGSIQVHFKVIGQRWKFKNGVNVFKNGVNVLKHEIPKNYLCVENGCYW